jgi:excisionase family DNA binding protein
MSYHRHHTQADQPDEWITLQEASELLGVTTSTVRRWADAGKLPVKRTLGKHRRFLRAAVLQLNEAPGETTVAPGQPREVWGVNTHELTRQQWHARLMTRMDSDRMRMLGQRLLGLLMQYINRREDDARFLNEARGVGANYGREARAAGVSMHDTVEAFLFFRGTFSQLALPLPGISQPNDLAEAAALHARIDRFMDAILLGTIAGYEGDDM